MNMKRFQLSLRLVLLGSFAVMMASCGNGEAGDSSPEMNGYTSEPEPVVIVIGNNSDITGPSSNAQVIINMCMEDMIEYFNEAEMIPGVELKMVTYDNQLDPSKYVTGYEWLRQKGADLMITGVPGVSAALKNRLEQDGLILFDVSSIEEGLVPPGRVFAPASAIPRDLGYVALRWIAENDPDFPVDRPARVGGAAWNELYMQSFFAGAKEYAREHPDKYDWKGGHFTDFTFVWSSQIEALKDCDYVLVPQIMHQFAGQYRNAGYKARFVGLDAQTAFFRLIDDANVWDQVDGTLFIRTTGWWNEDGEVIELARRLLNEKHPGESEDIMNSGASYLTVYCMEILFQMIAETVDEAGAGNFDADALYQVAQNFSMEMDGAQHSFTRDKRASASYARMYELRAEEEDIFLASPGWFPLNVP